MAAISINGVNELESREGHRWFELYGSFPAADNFLRRYRALAWANNAWLDTRIDFESVGQINVAIPMVATGVGCTFRVGLRAIPAHGATPSVLPSRRPQPSRSVAFTIEGGTPQADGMSNSTVNSGPIS